MHNKVFDAYHVYFLPSPGIGHFSKEPYFLYWKMVLENKIWGLGVLIAIWISSLLSPLNWQNKKICVCVLAYLHAHIYR